MIKSLAISLLFLFQIPFPGPGRAPAGGGGGGSIALVTSVGSTPNSGTAGSTTDPVDSTGGNFIALCVCSYKDVADATVLDSKSNTYTALTKYSSSTFPYARIYYAENATVGTGHTFTTAGATSYSTVIAMVFSGVKTSGSFDQENGSSGSGTTQATGSVTPSENNELLVAMTCDANQTVTPTVDASFASPLHIFIPFGQQWANGATYQIQTTATARNPTFTYDSSATSIAAAIATFKAQ